MNQFAIVVEEVDPEAENACPSVARDAEVMGVVNCRQEAQRELVRLQDEEQQRVRDADYCIWNNYRNYSVREMPAS